MVDLSLIQRRIYVDTFEGGDYTQDIEENLGLREPFCDVEHELEGCVQGTPYGTERQRELYEALMSGQVPQRVE